MSIIATLARIRTQIFIMGMEISSYGSALHDGVHHLEANFAAAITFNIFKLFLPQKI